MEIVLAGQIVILDEAHNIEDSARDAASFSTSQMALQDAMNDLQFVGKYVDCYSMQFQSSCMD